MKLLWYDSSYDIIAALKLIPDWFVTSKIIKKLFTALYADENIFHFNEDSSNVVFSCNEMDIVGISLSNAFNVYSLKVLGHFDTNTWYSYSYLILGHFSQNIY